MRLLRVGLLCLLTTVAFGQRHGGGFVGRGGFGHGMVGRGGVGHVGVGHAGFSRPGVIGGGFGFRGPFQSGFGFRGPFRSGFGNVVFPGTGFVRFGHSPRFGFFGGFGVPYSYPVFAGGYSGGYYGYDYAYPPPPPPPIVYQYTEPAPPVIVEQRFAPSPPVVREYAPDESEYREKIYLIAFKDGSIQAALAYWTEGGTLHYVNRQREHKTVSLSSVDRRFSEQLNRDRRVDFRLPPE